MVPTSSHVGRQTTELEVCHWLRRLTWISRAITHCVTALDVTHHVCMKSCAWTINEEVCGDTFTHNVRRCLHIDFHCYCLSSNMTSCWNPLYSELHADLPTSTFLPYLVRFLKGNTAVRFFLQKYVFQNFVFFFFFFFFFFFPPLESESSTLHTLFMKTWSEFLNNVQK